MKTLSDYNEEIKANLTRPDRLAELNVELSGLFAYYSEQFANFELLRADFWKDKEMSDKKIEMEWLRTENGIHWMRIKRQMRGIEKIHSSIKSLIYNVSREKNQSYE